MTGYRVLIADDEAMARSALADYLMLTGYEVIAASDGREAVEKAQRYRPDVVLLDVQMPLSDGFEALAALREDPVLTDVPVLLLTSLSRTNLKVRALDLGADDYIVKPFDRAELVARVRRALRRSARYRELAGTLQGDLANVSLPELLQTLELGRRTGRLTFPDLQAEILVERGHFRAARWLAREGTEVLVRLMLIPRGSFRMSFEDPSPLDGDTPPGIPIQEVILECAKTIDETRRGTSGDVPWDALVEPASAGTLNLPLVTPLPPGPVSVGELVARIATDLPAAARIVATALEDGAVRLVTEHN